MTIICMNGISSIDSTGLPKPDVLMTDLEIQARDARLICKRFILHSEEGEWFIFYHEGVRYSFPNYFFTVVN